MNCLCKFCIRILSQGRSGHVTKRYVIFVRLDTVLHHLLHVKVFNIIFSHSSTKAKYYDDTHNLQKQNNLF